jgi:glutamate---cysteine ligase / carboxylate-amine ligase
MLNEPLTLGVEEEFQIVDMATTELASGFNDLIQHATPMLHEHMKPEFLQCVIECITDVCPDVAAIHRATQTLRATAIHMARQHGLAIVSAGTHPTGVWYQQRRTSGDRYRQLEDMMQDIARSILIYGLHIHVGFGDMERRLAVMNQARTYLPHILALSTNSPFWMGRVTGFMSYRTVIWAGFPMAGVPDAYGTFAEYQQMRESFIRLGVLNDIRRIWWDVRLHPVYPTVEFRIADMPINHADTIAIVAFIQALTHTILQRIDEGHPLPVLSRLQVEENRWRAARYGLNGGGTFVDYVKECEVPICESIGEVLDMIAPSADELGATAQMKHLYHMIDARRYKSGAMRQIDEYYRYDDAHAATRLLIQETLRGVDLRLAQPINMDVADKSDFNARQAHKDPGPRIFLRRMPPIQQPGV